MNNQESERLKKANNHKTFLARLQALHEEEVQFQRDYENFSREQLLQLALAVKTSSSTLNSQPLVQPKAETPVKANDKTSSYNNDSNDDEEYREFISSVLSDIPDEEVRNVWRQTLTQVGAEGLQQGLRYAQEQTAQGPVQLQVAQNVDQPLNDSGSDSAVSYEEKYQETPKLELIFDESDDLEQNFINGLLHLISKGNSGNITATLAVLALYHNKNQILKGLAVNAGQDNRQKPELVNSVSTVVSSLVTGIYRKLGLAPMPKKTSGVADNDYSFFGKSHEKGLHSQISRNTPQPEFS